MLARADESRCRPPRRCALTACLRAHPARPTTGHVVSIVCPVEDLGVDLAEPFELLVEQDRVRDHELARVLGVSSRRFRSEPTLACTLITTASRIESIGGLVTCAKSCLKYE